jgi:hypothetical protein
MADLNIKKLRDVPDKMVRFLVIQADKEGFMRGGIAHSRKPVRHLISTLTDMQLTSIFDEKRLTVDIVDEPKPTEPKK